MMKDQFANYVVQKVLETCDDQQRELILTRIKVHLNALKKYTYGKHIVARVEKLVAAGGMLMFFPFYDPKFPYCFAAFEIRKARERQYNQFYRITMSLSGCSYMQRGEWLCSHYPSLWWRKAASVVQLN